MNLDQISKILVDSNEISNAIKGLKWITSSQESLKTFHELTEIADAISTQLDLLKNAIESYHPSSLPIGIAQSDLTGQLIEAGTLLQATCSGIRSKVNSGNLSFDDRGIKNKVILALENNGSYLESIAYDGKLKKLEEHPTKETMELLNLQDYPFYKVAEHDHSMWKIHECCPQIKVLVFFGAELQEDEVTMLNFDKMPNLKVLDLAENSLRTIPESLYKLTHLEYLSLRDNEIPSGELEKLKNMLSNTYVDY